MHGTPTVAVFRPDDDRLTDAVALLEDLGADPVPDPMLAVDATGATPRTDADYVVFTSKTGAELVSEAGWQPGAETVCAIGPATADALRAEGYAVDLVPEEFTSSGLVAALDGRIDGARVEVARSDHGSDVLLDGFEDAGAYVHETVLYRLVRPAGSGKSTELAAEGSLDALCFTSSLTVEHFLEAAAERGIREDALAGLADATVGVIGDPTAETARSLGIDVDVVPDDATFDALARETFATVPTPRE
ncbi:uroporphyrinogen-III synthase [Natronorubrum sp. JWXQ-INN-674]|uniref:Uroporphyrinogen-III synthase n=1 Tax=Natronorubrum halalkaliphilum TaxID=2691917 RepID=A0A6B0VM77_9EURY|nr:uroporphyrinogen-III synthase [Natronorubrum halalkaliphilum]MXV62664.1 uroporphyrinogen-III synthase [Natronorubrum halalkaliphilum]